MRETLPYLIIPIALVVYYLSHIEPIAAFHYFIAAGLVCFSMLGLRRASVLFIVMMILVDDFPKEYGEEALEVSGFVSLYTLTAGGQTLYLLLALYFAGANIAVLLTNSARHRRFVLTKISPEMKVIMALGASSALIGLANILDAFRIYVSDLGFFINILLGYLIVRSNAHSVERLNFLFRAIIFALGAKVFALLFDALTFSHGLEIVTIKPGSDSYLTVAIVLYAMFSIQVDRAVRPLTRAANIASIFGTIGYYALTAARGRIVFALLALAAYMFTQNLKRAIFYTALFVIAAIIMLRFVPEQFTAYLNWKLSSFAASSEVGQSSLVRLVSLKNIISQQLSTIYQLFVGTGLGGYFTSEYFPFPIALTEAAFPYRWIAEDRFYRPHGSLMFVLLKTGVVGFIILYGTIVWNNLKLLARQRSMKNATLDLRRIVWVSAPLIIPLFIVNFSSKLQLLSGVFLGLTYFAMRLIDEAKDGST